MQNNGMLFTVVYPQALCFFDDFCRCALNQTRKDFDLIIVNDGCDSAELKSRLDGLNVTILDSAGGIAQNRLLGIDFARTHHYKYVLFCDADDTFAGNRYERTVREFENTETDIVVSNLNIVDEQLKPLITDYFSLEIPEGRWIDKNFVKDKNVFGMSNTGIRVVALPADIIIPNTPVVDWYLFSVLLLNGLKAKYIPDALVNYRQYNHNMIGINCFDVASFKRLARLKHNHYRFLIDAGYSEFTALFKESVELQSVTDQEIEQLINKQLKIHKQPLWWQIIRK